MVTQSYNMARKGTEALRRKRVIVLGPYEFFARYTIEDTSSS